MAYEPHGDDVVFPVTGNEDLIAIGLSPEHDDDARDPYSLREAALHKTTRFDI
jgi:hypothetical protein